MTDTMLGPFQKNKRASKDKEKAEAKKKAMIEAERSKGK